MKRYTVVNITKTSDMKTRISFALALILILTTGSCQKIKDALTMKVDAEITVDLPVTIGGEPLKSVGLYPFTTSETLDLESNETVQQYKDRIRGYEVTGVTGTISGLATDFSLTLATATLSISSPGFTTQEWSFTNLVITNGTSVTFDNEGDKWGTVNEMLFEGNEITVTFSGSSNVPSVNYTLRLLIEVAIEAGILG